MDIEELFAVLIAKGKAEEKTIITTASPVANGGVSTSTIINTSGEDDKGNYYFTWKESLDAEVENKIKFEEFIDRGGGGEPDISISYITSAFETPRKFRIASLLKPIKDKLIIQFTNTDTSTRWTSHQWIGIKMRQYDYEEFIIPYINRILERNAIVLID